ncbi:ATP-binding protein [Xanthomonas maliensis]|uniref:ATP-binding protein n=1 Tax=Xanthomonas maliensis TaxID=1321368 RepID=UPI0003A0A2CE|nr:ATP-binding protein [Xanthomonas maliensis]KAB7766500.1 ATPase [Xanthomonas maliensis]
MSSHAGPDHALDLSSCAREPIHTPGAIQPYGLLLVIERTGWTVAQYAATRPELIDHYGEPLGRALDQVLGGLLAPHRAALTTLDDGATAFLGTVVLGDGRAHQLLANCTGGHLLVELEETVAGEAGTLEDLYPSIRSFMSAIEHAADTTALCDLAARQVRALTGFDRVLIYQFDKDWNGVVVAEDRNGVLPSYLDLRFPESDIPVQARDLYRRNRIRLIADCDYQPVPLLVDDRPPADTPADLSLCVLRSVSPFHLQYMRNMDTRASMSTSLLREGELWGLISCHSQAPRRVPYHVRTACELIGQILSLQLALKERAHGIEERVARRAIQVRLLSRMAGDDDFLAALGREHTGLLALTGAQGAAIAHRGECILLGDCPSRDHVLGLTHWLTSHSGEDLFHTDHLPALWEPANEFSDRASGVLAISISQLHDSYLLWFRPEVVRTVRWGGEPRKPNDGGMLSPRTSFEAWKETVRRQALPWSQADLDAAMELRTAIVDIVLRKAEEMAELNEQLVRSNKELEAFSYSVSHDLRAPFRHIVGYTELLADSAGSKLSDTEKRFLRTIAESAKSAGTLVDDLLSFSQMGRSTLGRVSIDMNTLVDDVRQRLDMEAQGREIHWEIADLPQVEVDPVMMRLVWQNLLTNAIKFTRDTAEPRIEIFHTRTAQHDVFHVRDNGCGFDMRYVGKLFGVFQRLHHADEYEGTGIGLANVRRIVSRHGGETKAEGELGRGATFSFSIPTCPYGVN